MASAGHRLELASSTANDAMRGISMQHYRLLADLPEDERFFAGAGFRREVDLQLLLVLVVRLSRAIGLALKLTADEDLAHQLAEFDTRVPAARQLRNVVEHFDDYIEGQGHRQASVSAGSLGVRIWNERLESTLTFAWLGRRSR